MRSKYCKGGRLPSNLLFMHMYAQKHPTDVYWVAAICQSSVGDAMVSKTQENTESGKTVCLHLKIYGQVKSFLMQCENRLLSMN